MKVHRSFSDGAGDCLRCLGFAAVLWVLFAGCRGCSGKASAQCAGGICPAPSYSAPPQWAGGIFNPQSEIPNPQSDHGWFKLANGGKLGLWHRGEYIGTLDSATMVWKHKDRPAVNLASDFGLRIAEFGLKDSKLARPKECLCKEDTCACAKCPNDCIAGKRIDAAAKRLAELADRLAQADTETRGQGDTERKSSLLPLSKSPSLRCGPDCVCGPTCDGNCDCCAFSAIPGSKNKEREPKNFGMDWKAPVGGQEICTVNGAKVSCQRLIETLSRNGGAADIPDDSRVNRLLLVSQDEKLRQAFLRDGARAKYDGKLIASAYAPDDWAVKWPGSATALYPMPADPTVYAINGDGKVVGHGTGYASPADFDQYVAAADKLRDKPAIDPLASPDLKSPTPPRPTPGPSPTPMPSPNGPAVPINPNHLGIAGLMALAGAAAYCRRRR